LRLRFSFGYNADMEAGTPRSWPPCVEVIDDRVAAILRAMTPEERWRRGKEFFLSSKAFVHAAIRSQHPDWTEEQVDIEWKRRIPRDAA
jgi:hypothetical protein